jgi:hypothetical protein
MTAPTQPQAQPERPSGPQAAAVADAQDYDVNALGPALAAFVAAVLAYSRGTGHLMGSPLTVARKVGYYAAVVAILRPSPGAGWTSSGPSAAPGRPRSCGAGRTGLAAGETAGLTTLAQAARVIARKARVDEARGGSPGVSLPGEPYDPQADEITRRPIPTRPRSRCRSCRAPSTPPSWRQPSEAGWTRKRWVDMHDNRVRVNHAFLGSQKYEFHTVPILEPFVTLDGNKLWYPGDTSAPVHEWMRCRCWLQLLR